MIAGNLRYKIEILAPVITTNDYGESVETFQLFTTLRANKKDVSGNKNVDNNELFSSNRIDFEIYYRPQITEQMRVKLNNKQYRIIYIQEIGYREGHILQTELINE